MSDLILQITCWQQLPQQNLHLKKIIIESVDSYLLLTNNIYQKLIPGIHGLLQDHLQRQSRNVSEPSSRWSLGPQGPQRQTGKTSPALMINMFLDYGLICF